MVASDSGRDSESVPNVYFVKHKREWQLFWKSMKAIENNPTHRVWAIRMDEEAKLYLDFENKIIAYIDVKEVVDDYVDYIATLDYSHG